MAREKQKPLRGNGAVERAVISMKGTLILQKVLFGEEIDIEDVKEYFGAMCDNIKDERKRIGGDWAVSCVTLGREVRDFIRFYFNTYLSGLCYYL